MSSSDVSKHAIRTAGTVNEFAVSTAYQFLDQAEDTLKVSESNMHSVVISHTTQFRADEVADAIKLIANSDKQYWGVIVDKTVRSASGVEVFFRAA